MRYCLFSVLCFFSALCQGEIRVTDDLGRNLQLEKPAQRIVSLAPHITEVLFEIGAGENIVGAMEYSDYPEAAKRILRVGSHQKISYETLVSLEPDLVLAWNANNGRDIVGRLETLGIPVYVGDPSTLADVGDMLGVFAQLTGKVEQGRKAQQSYQKRLQQLRQANTSKQSVMVFYQVWHQPLMTLNGDSLISNVIELCGGTNLFADAKPKVPRLNVESVIAANPRVIVASGADETRPPWLDDWLKWPSISAVKNSHLYWIDPDILHRHSPRILLGAEQVCGHLDRVRADISSSNP
ncbi:cobalamin-binding protein [bacterium SCSIO 12696]|nr:cobalamin-binding protein [bacterium SCSIO 12696]